MTQDYIELTQQQYAPVADQMEAMDNIGKLERLLVTHGFNKIIDRATKRDASIFEKYILPRDQHVEVATYFAGEPSTIRQKQEVVYDIKGSKSDVEDIIRLLSPQ